MRKIAPNTNSNANPKPNPDPERGTIFRTPFRSIKEKNRLISKGICVLLLDVFNRCSLVQLREVRNCNRRLFLCPNILNCNLENKNLNFDTSD